MTDKERARRKKRGQEYRKAYDALMKFYPFELDDLDGEIWEDIKGYEGHYQISNFGRVKSFWQKPLIMRPEITPVGYLQISLRTNNKYKSNRVHRLVAETFIPNADNKRTVNHVDGCKFNNHVSNLEWSTHTENIRHAYDTGLNQGSQGETNYQAGLSNEQAAWCRNVYIPGHPQFGATALAKFFGITEASIRAIVHGEHYRNVGGKIHPTIPKPRVPENIRNQIRQLYIKNSREFGTVALANRFEISLDTIKRILKEK